MHTLHNFGGYISTPTIRDLNKSIAGDIFIITLVVVAMIAAVGRGVGILLEQPAQHVSHSTLVAASIYFFLLSGLIITLGMWYITYLIKQIKAAKIQKNSVALK